MPPHIQDAFYSPVSELRVDITTASNIVMLNVFYHKQVEGILSGGMQSYEKARYPLETTTRVDLVR